MAAGDSFLYLDKRGGRYAFSGHGDIERVSSTRTTPTDSVTPRVRTIYTAELREYIGYSPPLDIRPNSVPGKLNRSILGITDVNRLGWSVSIASILQTRFEQVIELAYAESNVPLSPLQASDYEVPDTYSLVRRRHSLERFKATVLNRQNHTCAICGTTVKEVLDVAHISSYSSDTKNRANPGNGIGLCSFCHRAFDKRVFVIGDDGCVFPTRDIEGDPIAKTHLSGLSLADRRQLLAGVDREFLCKRLAYGSMKETCPYLIGQLGITASSTLCPNKPNQGRSVLVLGKAGKMSPPLYFGLAVDNFLS